MSNPIKKTMVYLGLADEEPVGEQAAAAPRPHAPVTPLRKSAPAPTAEMNEILTVHPRQYRDAQTVADDVREGYVSREAAEKLYGVVLDANGEVLSHETQQRRAQAQ